MMTTSHQTQALGETFNFAQHLITINADRASKAAFIDDTGVLSYGELAERIKRFATGLLAAGIRREERVLLLMQDCCDWPVAFLGSMYAGVVPVAVNTLLTADDYAYMLAHSRSQAVIVSHALLPTLNAALTQAPHEVKTIIVSQAMGHLPDHAVDMGDFIDKQVAQSQPEPTRPDDPGFWLYSSGSTGRPKGTLHTHANPYWTAELYGKGVLGLTENDVCFSAAKLFFAYGLGNGLSFPLSAGATTVLMAERPTPDATFKRWTDSRPGCKPTIFFGAPTGFAGMLASPNLPAKTDVSLRMCSSAGEALPAELGEKFKRHFRYPAMWTRQAKPADRTVARKHSAPMPAAAPEC